MPNFNKGDMVMINPSIGEDDFQYGLGGVGYQEIGYIQRAESNGSVSVNWPDSYGAYWMGLDSELIPVENEE